MWKTWPLGHGTLCEVWLYWSCHKFVKFFSYSFHRVNWVKIYDEEKSPYICLLGQWDWGCWWLKSLSVKVYKKFVYTEFIQSEVIRLLLVFDRYTYREQICFRLHSYVLIKFLNIKWNKINAFYYIIFKECLTSIESFHCLFILFVVI